MEAAVFKDFDEFADALTGVDGRYIPTARSQCEWSIAREEIRQLTLQRVIIGAPATFAGDGQSCGLTSWIPITDARSVRIDGIEMAENGFVVVRSDRPLTYSAPQPTYWFGITVPWSLFSDPRFEEAADIGLNKLYRARASSKPQSLRVLGSLIGAFCGEIRLLSNHAAASAEEQLLLASAQVLRDSVRQESDHRVGRAPIGRDRIIAQCLEFFRESRGQPILVSDLCRHANVAERTLRTVFHEYFGVGPARFLKARQLHELRHAFLRAQKHETVSSIGARFGVWDFSLLARSYRAMYGEGPSQTLRESRVRPFKIPSPCENVEQIRSWMQYASLRFERGLSATDNARIGG